jgi:NADH-quinone oxidoreductase subunit J
MVLFLFVIMMLDINVAQLREGFTRHAPLGALVAGLMIAEIVYVVWTRHLGMVLPVTAPPLPEHYSNTHLLGQVLYTDYMLPFQLAAIVLLIAIVAAIALTMRHRSGFKKQDIGAQVARRREDAVRVVKVEAEKAS